MGEPSRRLSWAADAGVLAGAVHDPSTNAVLDIPRCLRVANRVGHLALPRDRSLSARAHGSGTGTDHESDHPHEHDEIDRAQSPHCFPFLHDRLLLVLVPAEGGNATPLRARPAAGDDMARLELNWRCRRTAPLSANEHSE